MADDPLVVVGLGVVDPDLVEGSLGTGIRFVASPNRTDLAIAVGAIVRADFVADAAFMATAPNLRVLARTGVGVERVDLDEATRRGIAVVITPDSGTRAVAEGALGMALSLAKRFGPHTVLVRTGHWPDRASIPVGDLDGATLGIVGYGRIGRRLAELATVFGMTVRAFDPYARVPPDLRCDELGTLVEGSDFVSLHVPLTDDTHHLINAEAIARMRPGSFLVNCGRGAVLDLNAAHAALLDGHLAGVGLDVFDPEPPSHHPIFDHPNVVLTPHVMGLSARAMRATFADAAVGLVEILNDRTAPVANPERTST